MKSLFPRITSRSGGAMARLRPRLKLSFRRSTTPRCAGCRSRISGLRTREIELTSYAEIVLAPPAADAAHPAFSNLFVQTEFVPELGALLATRRPRSHGEPQVWAAHVVVAEGETVGELQYETDRARFLGRGRGIRTPMSVIDGHPLSNTVGAVLDPIVSLRRRVRLAPGATRAGHVLDAHRAIARRSARPGRRVQQSGNV